MPPASAAPRTAVLSTLLVVATLLVFGLGLAGDFVWDDVPLIARNAALRDGDRLLASLAEPFWHDALQIEQRGRELAPYYRPFVTLAYGVQFRLFGESPAGYHAVSLAVHLATALLVFAWLRRRVRAGAAGTHAPDDGAARLAAAFGAALFALHPTRPESVVWISGSTDLWMGLWVMAALNAWQSLRGVRRWLVFAPTYLLACASKEPAFLLPVLLLVDALLLAPAADGRRWRERVPWRALGGAFLLLGVALFLRGLVLETRVNDPLGDGAGALVERVAASAGHYARQLFAYWPATVQEGYRVPAPGEPTHAPWSVVVGGLALAALAVVAALAARRARWRPRAADLAWVVVPLAPALNIIPFHMYFLVAARFLYLPLLGLAALFARALAGLVARGGRARRAALLGGGAVVAAAGALSLQHVPLLLDGESLWAHEHALEPRNAIVARNYAAVLRAKGRNDDAIAVLARTYGLLAPRVAPGGADDLALDAVEVALRNTPDSDRGTLERIDAFYRALAGDAPASLDAAGLRITLAPPADVRRRLLRSALAYRLPRAVVALRLRRFGEAEAALHALTRDEPAELEPWGNLVLALARQGRWQEAAHAAKAGLALRPTARFLAAAHAQLSRALAETAAAQARPAAEALGVRVRWLLELGALERAVEALRGAPTPLTPALAALRAEAAARARAQGLAAE